MNQRGSISLEAILVFYPFLALLLLCSLVLTRGLEKRLQEHRAFFAARGALVGR